MDMYQKRKIRAEKKKEDSPKSFPSVGINWYPGHMAKTKREIKESLNLVDIVYEVIDARMPLSSKIIDIDDIVKDKPRILIVTKYDICDDKETDLILKKYEQEGYIVIKCNLLNRNGIKEILNQTKNLAKKINDDRAKKGLKPRRVRALVIGVPNVGKSTLINALVGKKAVNVGNTPGVTKNLSWIRINDNVELLDSPGILWPKIDNQIHAYNLAALSSIKEEIVDSEALCKYIIEVLEKYYPENLISRYNLQEINYDTIYDDIAKKRGFYLKGGAIDYEKVYNTVINDLKSASLGKVTFDRL